MPSTMGIRDGLGFRKRRPGNTMPCDGDRPQPMAGATPIGAKGGSRPILHHPTQALLPNASHSTVAGLLRCNWSLHFCEKQAIHAGCVARGKSNPCKIQPASAWHRATVLRGSNSFPLALQTNDSRWENHVKKEIRFATPCVRRG